MTDTATATADVALPLMEKVDRMAAERHKPRGWVVEQALAAWIEREETRHRLTVEALAEVDGGRLVDHAAVQAWADGLPDGIASS